MKGMRWLLLLAVALASVQDAKADESSLLALEETLLASIQLPTARRHLSVDLFHEHAARYLVASADTTTEITALFNLYKKLYTTQVVSWGSTVASQTTYFEENVFPRIQDKANELLLIATSSSVPTNIGDQLGVGVPNQNLDGTMSTVNVDSTTSGSPSSNSETTAGGTSGTDETSSSGKSTREDGTSNGLSTPGEISGGANVGITSTGTSGGVAGGPSSSEPTFSGTPTAGNVGTSSGGVSISGTSLSGAFTSGNPSSGTAPSGTSFSGNPSSETSPSGTSFSGNPSSGNSPSGTSSSGNPFSGTSPSGTFSSGNPSSGTSPSGTPSSGNPSSGTSPSGTPSSGNPTSGTSSSGTISSGISSSGNPSSGTASGGTSSGGSPSTATSSSGTPTSGIFSGRTPLSGGSSLTSGGNSNVTPLLSRTTTVDVSFNAAVTSPMLNTASGSFWTATYNVMLSSNVASLRPQSRNVETVVQSSSAANAANVALASAAARYQAPTLIYGYTQPSRRLQSGALDTSDIDLLFCDVAGNAIWKWSAQDVPDASVSNVSNALANIDVDVDGVCLASSTLGVSAYQSGCSLQNHPEGCDNVYYKGCGGITVSPTSDRIVIARTGGRTLGVLNYNTVGTACQGQVVDAISTYRGKKFNSPTFAEYANNGILYFTDSPFGLATSEADFDGDTLDKSPLREIPYNGVYMLRNGTGQSVELVDCEMRRPNKIAFSPSNDIMYITNSQKGDSYIKSYVLADDGTVTNSSIFFNFTAHPELETSEGSARGIKVDINGFVYVVCYKGVYVFSPEAELAGAIMSSEILDSVTLGLGRLFITGSFGIVAHTSGVASQTIPQAQVTCSA